MAYDTTGIPAILWAKFERFDLTGADWHFVVDEDSPFFIYQRRHETSRQVGQALLYPIPGAGYIGHDDLPGAIRYCMAAHWGGIRLAVTLRQLDGRCSWPGGYDAPAIYEANQRYFEEEYGEHPAVVDVDGMPGIDPLLVGDDDAIIDDVGGLENYPVLCEETWSQVELERQDKAWESWAASEWRDGVHSLLRDAIEANLPDDSETDPDELADTLLDGKDDALEELFRACCDSSNTYWCEESDGSQYIRMGDVLAAVDVADLRNLAGLPLLPPDQQWRREPYPWLGAEPEPLVGELA